MMTRLEMMFYKHFSVVVSVSPAIQGILEGTGISKDRLKIIPNGIFVDDYGKSEARKLLILREELGISVDDLVVVNIGRLTEQKAQANLVEAASILKKEGVQLKFLVVGEGHLREMLEASIGTFGVEDSFHLLGFRADIVDILRASDIFVLPSNDEGMPIAILEATAVGLPVVSTRVGFLPEIFKEEKEVFFIPDNMPRTIADGIKQLARDPLYREQIGYSGKEKTTALFSSKKMYEKYASVYSELYKSC